LQGLCGTALARLRFATVRAWGLLNWDRSGVYFFRSCAHRRHEHKGVADPWRHAKWSAGWASRLATSWTQDKRSIRRWLISATFAERMSFRLGPQSPPPQFLHDHLRQQRNSVPPETIQSGVVADKMHSCSPWRVADHATDSISVAQREPAHIQGRLTRANIRRTLVQVWKPDSIS
jgi:hypothetical protein